MVFIYLSVCIYILFFSWNKQFIWWEWAVVNRDWNGCLLSVVFNNIWIFSFTHAECCPTVDKCVHIALWNFLQYKSCCFWWQDHSWSCVALSVPPPSGSPDLSPRDCALHREGFGHDWRCWSSCQLSPSIHNSFLLARNEIAQMKWFFLPVLATGCRSCWCSSVYPCSTWSHPLY